jgi:hypothetical protein
LTPEETGAAEFESGATSIGPSRSILNDRVVWFIVDQDPGDACHA